MTWVNWELIPIIVIFILGVCYWAYSQSFYGSYHKYPLKLHLLWFLMFMGLRTDGMSTEAHRIYNNLQVCEESTK